MSGAAPSCAGVLLAPTPAQWVETARVRWQELLIDHANCEKKAASTALALLFAYPEDARLALALARLAREELRHFEQVQKLMRALGVAYERRSPGRYASSLRAVLRTSEPGRKVDVLLCGALIEARSAERFALLRGRLPAPMDEFYARLAEAEARHFELYLDFARASAPESWQERLLAIGREESRLVTQPDTEFRFHSGPVSPDEAAELA